jgi:hypothetical protein
MNQQSVCFGLKLRRLQPRHFAANHPIAAPHKKYGKQYFVSTKKQDLILRIGPGDLV